MANRAINNSSYGFGGSPIVNIFPAPIVSQRNPSPSDFSDIGQSWINTVTNAAYVLTSIVGGAAVWTAAAPAAAGVFTDLTATGTISLISPVSSTYQVTGAGQNVDISSTAGSVNITGSIAAANAVAINSPAGGITLTSNDNITFVADTFNYDIDSFDLAADDESEIKVKDAGEDLKLTSTLGSIIITGGEAAADAVQLVSNGGITAGSNGDMAFNAGGGIGFIAVDESGFTVTGAGNDLALRSTIGKTIISGGEAVADAVTINSITGGGIDINSNAGLTADTVTALSLTSVQAAANAINLNAVTAGGGIDINAGTGGLTLDATGASHFIATGAVDLTLTSTLGRNIINGGVAAANAITLNALTAGGGIDINAVAGGITVDTSGLLAITSSKATAPALTITASTGVAGSVLISSTLGTAADAIGLSATAGGVTITTGAVAAATGLHLTQGAETAGIYVGTGSPDGVVTAARGSLYLSTDGGASTLLWSNSDGATAWLACATV